jgi:uncharacterized protein YdcH (DUF465 family)
VATVPSVATRSNEAELARSSDQDVRARSDSILPRLERLETQVENLQALIATQSAAAERRLEALEATVARITSLIDSRTQLDDSEKEAETENEGDAVEESSRKRARLE